MFYELLACQAPMHGHILSWVKEGQEFYKNRKMLLIACTVKVRPGLQTAQLQV